MYNVIYKAALYKWGNQHEILYHATLSAKLLLMHSCSNACHDVYVTHKGYMHANIEYRNDKCSIIKGMY